MVDRPNKPMALATTPGLPPQAQVNITHNNSRVSAVLPTGESVEVLLYGATLISWKDRAGSERLWLSEGAKLDGSKAVRGGIPLVFPVFGTAPEHKAAGNLPQHGFARTSKWEFLGKSTSESQGKNESSVKLDFGLSAATIDDETKKLWPYNFSLIYSVSLTPTTLSPASRSPTMDIAQVSVTGLDEAEYIDKVDGAKAKKQSGTVSITGETDRVYTPAKGPSEPVVVSEGGRTVYSVVRDNLEDVVVWNPWTDKAQGMADFEPKDGYKNMICIEAGAVKGWQKLEKGDTFEGAQTISV
ncbi:galactose mutarotase-like domain-containing protein [Pseudomassariella vexata]|uniref:Glucose-6-phosphate 1-epimerase n=1 Tax=Pseudomassariella vexata TaxID=1141098 RepID=A0A1Y2DD65_9PEZI|nr:galactose mutarotase-like domain-containing protein [Pseudomassariella vexata]ORY57137.1 galactose mutarotase-like domain-containing protein [Pseudomassariella vexata]